MRQPEFSLSRRGFVRGLAATAGLALVAACAPASSGGGSPATGAGQSAGAGAFQMPTYMPAQGPTPDVAGNAQGVEPGYVAFPKQLSKTVQQVPSSGGDVTGMVLANVNGVPVAAENNAAWQQLNKALGANLKLILSPQADYAAKWGTMTSGGDLPDIMYVSIVPTLPNVAAFLKSACADLTPYLGGDAVKDYPNLANIPPASWRAAVLNNAIYGVPIPRPITTGPYSMLFFQGIFRAPNNWRVDSAGKLVKDIEADEYKAAVAFARDLVSSGYVSPDVSSTANLNIDFYNGKIAMRGNAWNAYSGLYTEMAPSLNIDIRTIPPFGFDGGAAAHMLGPGNFGYAVIKKASADRVKELLRVFNYLAGPFGSEEYMVTKFGVKEVDYTYTDKGNPVFTDQGKAELPGSPTVPWGYIATAPPVLFSVNTPDFGRWGHDEEERFIAAGVADPTIGKYSPTYSASGAPLDQLIFDRVSGIVAGRQPMSDLDQLVRDWRAQGGDKVRAEYEQSLQNG